MGRHRPRTATDQHSPLGLARPADEPEERQRSVRGDDRACSDGSSQASSPSQLTRAVPGRWEADHSAGRLVARSLRGAPGECADRRSHPASHVLLAPGDARGGDAVGAGTGRPPGSDDDPAVFAPESGRVDRHRSVAGIESGRLRAWRNTGDGRRPRSEVEVLERDKWLGGRDSNPDNGVQSAVSYR